MHDMIRKMMLRFRDIESGATLVEYGIAITLAIVLGTGALTLLAGNIAGAMGEAGEVMPGDAIDPDFTPTF